MLHDRRRCTIPRKGSGNNNNDMLLQMFGGIGVQLLNIKANTEALAFPMQTKFVALVRPLAFHFRCSLYAICFDF